MCVERCGSRGGGGGPLGHITLVLYHVLISPSSDRHIIRVTASRGLADCQDRGGQLGRVSPQLSYLLAERGTNHALECLGVIPLLVSPCLQRRGVGEGQDFGCMQHPIKNPHPGTSLVV